MCLVQKLHKDKECDLIFTGISCIYSELIEHSDITNP